MGYILDNFCNGEVSILRINGVDYFGFLTQMEWDSALAEAAQMLKFGAGEKWSEDYAVTMVQGIIKEKAKEFRGIFAEMVFHLGHFVATNSGVRILVSYGRGADQAVSAVLAESATPLHYSEIAVRASARQGRTIEVRRAHSSAAAVGILLGRGTYGTERHLICSRDEMDRALEGAEEVVLSGPANRQWHTAEILSALIEVEVPIGSMTKYILDFILRSSRVLKSLGRMAWVAGSDSSWVSASRIDLRQAIISLIESAGRPLSSREVRSRLVAVRGTNEVFQFSSLDPIVRLGFGLWGLNDRDLPIKRPNQPAFFDDLEELVAKRAVGVHISEIESLSFGWVSGIPGSIIFGLSSLVKRFHVATGQYLYLSEWGGPRRETLSEAIKLILDEHSRPLSLDEIVLIAGKRLNLSLDRTAVSGRLQALDAVFNTVDRTWLARSSWQDQVDDEDFGAALELDSYSNDAL